MHHISHHFVFWLHLRAFDLAALIVLAASILLAGLVVKFFVEWFKRRNPPHH